MTGPDNAAADDALLDVHGLSVDFSGRKGNVRVVDGISFSLRKGRVLCIIGESGSGKSVTMRALMRLLPERRTRISGSVQFEGTDVMTMNARTLAAMRGGRMAMIFQEPMTALDPVFTIGSQIAETVMRHKGYSRQRARDRVLELLNLVRIPSPERRLDNYAHELSGGLRQRAMIAMALSCAPSLLLADEPTTALDATVQIQLLILLKGLQQDMGMGIIFVTHDLGVAAQIADDVAVMYAGRIVEYGPVQQVLLEPRHPYTRGMLASSVQGQRRDADIQAIPGSPPDLRSLPPGCSFAPRCAYCTPACLAAMPGPSAAGAGYARCFRLDDIAPSILAEAR